MNKTIWVIAFVMYPDPINLDTCFYPGSSEQSEAFNFGYTQRCEGHNMIRWSEIKEPINDSRAVK